MNIKKSTLLFITIFLFGMINVQSQINFTADEKAWIKDHPVINFGYESNWPPYEIYTNGEYSGIVGDYVKLIEKDTGIDMKPIPGITWDETISKLKSGDIHVVPIAGITDERKEYLKFTDPYISDPLVIITRNDFQFISGLADLEDKILCLPKGYYTIDMVKNDFPKMKIITTNSVQDCLLEVSTSRADAFVGSLSVVSYYINTIGFANLKIASSTHYGYTQMGFAVTKDWAIFNGIVQKIFDNISKEKHNEIKSSWIAVRYDHGVDEGKVKTYVLYALGIVVLLLISLYIWNTTLRKQIRIRKKAEFDLSNSLELISQQNSEKEILLKEIHHRVKNNLQIVYSLLNMQSREIKNEDVLMVLSEGKTRIKAMSLVHQVLYQSDNLSEVNINKYIKSLKKSVASIYFNEKKDIKVNIEVENVTLSLEKSIPFGLILNELLTNSYKHAFVNRVSGEISISITKNQNMYSFVYKDNGVGLENLNILDHKTLGMRLISRLSNQLNTQATLKNENGIAVKFNFK